jgi:hypothetical protein
MEWDVVVPFVPDSGLDVKVYPSGSQGSVQVTLLDFSGKEFLSQSFSRDNGILAAPKAKLPPPGGLASRLPPKPVLAPYMGAYLFPWYGLPTGPTKALVHWDAGNFIFHPAIGQYDSGDPETIRRQLGQMRKAGFNLAVVSYWDQEGSNKNLAPILAEAPNAGLAISAMLETVVRRPGVGPKECLLAQIQEIRRAYAGQAAWLKAEGKPILFVYDRIVAELNAADGGKWWDDWLWVRQQAGNDFILMAPITDSTTPDQIKATGGGSVFAANSGAGNPWVGADAMDWQWAWTAYQGGGLSALPILPRFQRAAEPGDIPNYRNQWRAARAAMPDIILVNSWNEYHESSVIEPTAEFDEDWLRLSAREADLFCRGEPGAWAAPGDTAIPPAAIRPGAPRGARSIQVTYAGGRARIRVPDPALRIVRLRDGLGRAIRALDVANGEAAWDGLDARGRVPSPGPLWIEAGSDRAALPPR